MNNLNEVFETDNQELDKIDIEELLPAVPVKDSENAIAFSEQTTINDIDYSRESLKYLSKRSQQLLEVAIERVLNGGSARDLEVTSQLLNNSSEILEKLIELHDKSNELTTNKPNLGKGNTFVQNQNVFYGSTSELLKGLNNGKNEFEIHNS